MAPTVKRLSSTLQKWVKTLGPNGGASLKQRHMGCAEYTLPRNFVHRSEGESVFDNGFVPELFD